MNLILEGPEWPAPSDFSKVTKLSLLHTATVGPDPKSIVHTIKTES